MTRLHDAFEQLIARHAPGDPEADLAIARRRARTATVRRRAIAGASIAAAAAVVVGALVLAGRDDGSESVRAGETERSTTTTAPDRATTTVDVHLSPPDDPTCAATVAVPRTVSADDALAGAIAALLAGPTAEEAADGLTSWFSSETAGTLQGVEVRGTTAVVDFANFAPTISNASTSCGSTNLLAQLDATVTAFPGVDRAVYRFDGDADAFYGWLQREAPEVPPASDATPPDEADGASAAVDDALAVAGPTGVQVLADGRATTISRTAAALALVADAPGVASGPPQAVAYQDALADDAFPPTATGPIHLIDGRDHQTVAPAPDGRSLRLLDLRVDDAGRAVVLAAELTGPETPDGQRERLVVHHADGTRTELADRNGWEDSTVSAHLLPDGSVVALRAAGASSILTRWAPDAAEPAWSVDVAVDRPISFVADDERAVLLIGRPDALEVQTIDLGTGAVVARVDRQLTLAGRPLPEGLVCTDLLRDGRPLCSSPSTGPVVVDADGTVRSLDRPGREVVTAAGR